MKPVHTSVRDDRRSEHRPGQREPGDEHREGRRDGHPFGTAIVLAAQSIEWNRELAAAVTQKADAFGRRRNAQVAFLDRSTNVVIGTAYVTDCDADCTSGLARVTWDVNLGSAKSKTFTIGFLVTGYYSRSNTLDNVNIVITKQ
jgi:hypothetical protein